MAQRTKKVRHVQKHDIEAHWKKAINFIPLPGEIIIYDADEYNPVPRVKIGDGNIDVNNLPFQPDRAILDVFDRLPEDDINMGVFYRLITGTFIFNQFTQDKMFCYCVEALPNEGFPALSGDLSSISNTTITAYYNVSDNEVYGYVSEQLSTVFGVPAGWYPCAVLMEAVGESFGGIIVNIKDDPMDNTFRLLLEYKLYYYNGSWESLNEEQEIIQSDWNQMDDTQPDYIKNKPDVVQSDWNIADESDLAAIKNKPFGMVEQIVSVLPETTFTFTEVGSDGIIGNVGFNWSLFEEDTVYSVWLNGEYIGAAQPNQRIPIPNGEFYFSNGALVIYGGNYPVGQYTIRIDGPQRITKKLDSQYLNLCTDLNNLHDNLNPVTGDLLAEVRAEFGMWQANLNNRLDVSTGPVPNQDGADAGKVLTIVGTRPTWQVPPSGLPDTSTSEEGALLQIVNGTPTWVSITNGNEVAY